MKKLVKLLLVPILVVVGLALIAPQAAQAARWRRAARYHGYGYGPYYRVAPPVVRAPGVGVIAPGVRVGVGPGVHVLAPGVGVHVGPGVGVYAPGVGVHVGPWYRPYYGGYGYYRGYGYYGGPGYYGW